MFSRTVLPVLCVIFFPSAVFGQVGLNSTLWSFSEPDVHHQSIVQVTVGPAMGTGVIIDVLDDKPIKDGFEGYCLTAFHVVEDDNGKRNIKVTYRNGRRASNCKVIKFDKAMDVALIWVWVPGDVKPATLAEFPILPGEEIEIAGLGGGSPLKCCVRHFEGTASGPTNPNKIFADVPLLPGDSGGPVFNARRELVGIVSGGWFWWDGNIRDQNGSGIRVTWPARTSNLTPLYGLLGLDLAGATAAK